MEKSKFIAPNRAAMMLVADVYQSINNNCVAAGDESGFLFVESVEVDNVRGSIPSHTVTLLVHSDCATFCVDDDVDDEDEDDNASAVITAAKLGACLYKLKKARPELTIKARLSGRVPVEVGNNKAAPVLTRASEATRRAKEANSNRALGAAIINAPVDISEIANEIAQAAVNDIVKAYADSAEEFDAGKLFDIIHQRILDKLSAPEVVK